jgi:hypothetical protein
MFINDQNLDQYADLQQHFWDETFRMECAMFKGKARDWSELAALDVIKMYCGM